MRGGWLLEKGREGEGGRSARERDWKTRGVKALNPADGYK